MTVRSEKLFYLGVDSDGCAIDSMEFKHRKCFAPATRHVWDLEPYAEAVVDAALFVNLYSSSRGKNRFPALLETLDLLKTHPAVRALGHELEVPGYKALRAWLAEEAQPSGLSLEKAARARGDSCLMRVLRWNREVNENIRTKARNLSAFPGVKKALESAAGRASVHIVSSANSESVRREWDANGLLEHVAGVSAQESGTKEDALHCAEDSGFGASERLLIGDSPGDQKAAERTGSLFYPIIPGDEAASWHRFTEEALPRWFDRRFDRDYQTSLLSDFGRALPSHPPWNDAKTETTRA